MPMWTAVNPVRLQQEIRSQKRVQKLWLATKKKYTDKQSNLFIAEWLINPGGGIVQCPETTFIVKLVTIFLESLEASSIAEGNAYFFCFSNNGKLIQKLCCIFSVLSSS